MKVRKRGIREEGKKKGIKKCERGRKKRERRRKRGERGRNKTFTRKGREHFQMCWGRFSTMLCVENLPTLKDEGKKGREENIVKGAGAGFQQCYALKPSPAT